MGPEVANKNKNCVFSGPYAGRDLYITMYRDNEREFVVTHNANIKPVSYFTGRETELQELRQRIEEGRKSVLVSGMGGIGKTHICRKLFEEYLNKHAADEDGPFRHIGYVEYSGDMGSSLQNCLKFKQQESPEQNQEAAWRELEYLASDGKLLLFVDNVDKTLGADLGLQRLKGIPGAVVLTSRQASFSDEFEPYRIEFLDMEQCKEIYEKIRFEGRGKKVNAEEVPDLEYVIESLAGRHTITVELLAHLARTKLWTVKRLREELEKKGFLLEFHKDGELVNIQKSYEVLYDLSMLTKAEQNILEAFSVFPYIPLAAEICNEWLLEDAGVSEEDDVLIGLYRKGWLQFDVGQVSYAMHPVFARFIYEKYKPKMENHLWLIDSCQKNLVMTEERPLLECEKYIPFAKSLVEKVRMDYEIRRARFMDYLSGLYRYMADYKLAEFWYMRSLEIYKDAFGEYHKDISRIYNNLATLYDEQEEYGKALELYENSLRIQKQIFGKYHPNNATIYCNLAQMYVQQKEYGKAQELCERSIEIREAFLGNGNPKTAMSYNELGNIYRLQGNYDKAYELLIKSLRIMKNTLGKRHPNTANCYNDLALVYYEQKNYKKAYELLYRSLMIRRDVLGEKHPCVAESNIELAELYDIQGKFQKALFCFYEAYRIWIYRLGLRHSKTQSAYKKMEKTYLECNPEGNFEQWLEEKMKE